MTKWPGAIGKGNSDVKKNYFGRDDFIFSIGLYGRREC